MVGAVCDGLCSEGPSRQAADEGKPTEAISESDRLVGSQAGRWRRRAESRQTDPEGRSCGGEKEARVENRVSDRDLHPTRGRAAEKYRHCVGASLYFQETGYV